jgi:hypothetical protein
VRNREFDIVNVGVREIDGDAKAENVTNRAIEKNRTDEFKTKLDSTLAVSIRPETEADVPVRLYDPGAFTEIRKLL